MDFGWRRWIPDERHDIEDELGNIIGWGLRAMSDDRPSVAHEQFIKLWGYWNKLFPGRWILSTLTTESPYGYTRDIGIRQLRFWFGEPQSLGPSHVNSDGHNLIAQVDGLSHELMAFSKSLHGGEFTMIAEHSCWTWRRI